MSFERLDITNNNTGVGRSCIIICNFNEKELKLVKSYCKLIGINDQIIISYKNSESKIEDIIDNANLTSSGDGRKDKAIIFNNVTNAKINIFIENLKKIRINKPLIATVTETSKHWTLDTLLNNLVAERIALKSGKNLEHK